LASSTLLREAAPTARMDLVQELPDIAGRGMRLQSPMALGSEAMDFLVFAIADPMQEDPGPGVSKTMKRGKETLAHAQLAKEAIQGGAAQPKIFGRLA
jgi:hypothetical protein